MTHSQNRIQILGLILILAVVSGCVSTTDVDTPDQVNPNSTFQAIVTVEVDEGGTAMGYMCVLVPNGWGADSVTYAGPYSGNMIYDEDVTEYIESYYSSASWDHWIGFQSENAVEGAEGDIYEFTMTIHTDPIMGFVEIAFLGIVDVDGWCWNGDPCSTTVEVVELYLEQSTWGSVKSEFSL